MIEATTFTSIGKLGSTYLKHSFGADNAAGSIVEMLNAIPVADLDREAYLKLREAFLKGKPASMLDDTAKKQWERLFKASHHEIPKSKSADAAIKANARSKKKAAIEKLDDATIEKKVQALKSAGFTDSEAVVKDYVKELEKRQEAANKPAMDALKKARDTVAKAVKSADAKTLEQVAKLLKVELA